MILIADDFHPDLMNQLEQAGIAFKYLPDIDREGVKMQLKKGIRGLVIRSKTTLDSELLYHATNLKLIARGGSGMDGIDVPYAESLGITLINAAEANRDAVAEHTIGMLLGLLHKIAKGHREISQNIWNREDNRGTELGGKTVGIIGYGNAGSAVAEKLIGFKVNVLAYDKYKSGFGNSKVKQVGMTEIFENADIVTLHVPLDSHTKFMANSDFFQSFVRKIILLNLSRGSVVKTSDVVEGLKSGKILGFGADVLEHEDPLQMGDSDKKWFDELKQMNHVILTPHVGGWSVESYQKISDVLAAKIISNRSLVAEN